MAIYFTQLKMVMLRKNLADMGHVMLKHLDKGGGQKEGFTWYP